MTIVSYFGPAGEDRHSGTADGSDSGRDQNAVQRVIRAYHRYHEAHGQSLQVRPTVRTNAILIEELIRVSK